MAAYYNDNDKNAAAWLRELIKRGLLPDGEVDERSITDIRGHELAGFEQCHFFAGIGGWPYALKLAGWNGPCWTGSCPCQPFSQAGKQLGEQDERHLWPEFRRLIAECEPPIVFGEQVASKAGRAWLAGVRADLEALGYGVGAADLCAASVGAPHIRQRLFWVADARSAGAGRNTGTAHCKKAGGEGPRRSNGDGGGNAPFLGSAIRGLGDAIGAGLEKRPGESGNNESECAPVERTSSNAIRLGDTENSGREECSLSGRGCEGDSAQGSAERSWFGLWSSAEWLQCLDGKARRVEPGIFPLAHGVPARVGRLRGYGNAIVPQAAEEFVSAFLDVKEYHNG